MPGVMTYHEACETELTRSQARREVKDHGCSWFEFVEEVGDQEVYSGQVILDWLGY